MDKFIYLVEYWYINDEDNDTTISLHATIFGAETRARELAEEQLNDELEHDPEHRVTWHRNDDGNGIASIEVKDGTVIESWTVIRKQLEE